MRDTVQSRQMRGYLKHAGRKQIQQLFQSRDELPAQDSLAVTLAHAAADRRDDRYPLRAKYRHQPTGNWVPLGDALKGALSKIGSEV